MKLLISNLLLFIVLLSSCLSKENHEPTFLSTKDQNLVITQGYAEYLALKGRNQKIYCRYTVLEDTVCVENLLYQMEGKSGKTCNPSNDDLIPIGFEDSINPTHFKQFSFFDDHYIDSISRANINNYGFNKPFYAITRPYQPDTCNLAIIQEFEIPEASGCIPFRNRILIFEKRNGVWRYLESQ